MPISFDHIPSNIRVPLFWAEISNSEANTTSGAGYPALLFGPMTAQGKANPLEPVLVSGAAEAAALFGVDSILADMAKFYRYNDSFGELWAVGVLDGTGYTAAASTVTFTGTATASSQIALYIGSTIYRVVIPAKATDEDMAAALVAAVEADPFALVTAEAESGVVTLTATGGGALGNTLPVILNRAGLSSGEFVPAGVTVAVTAFTGGAGTPDLTAALAAVKDDEYDYVAWPWTDEPALDLFQTWMDGVTGRWAFDKQIYGHGFAAKADTSANLSAFGRTRNDPHISIFGVARSASAPWQRAAAITAQAASALRIDPARPLQTLPLVGIYAPGKADKFSLNEQNTLLWSGIAIEGETSGQVVIKRAVTTYQRNAWGQPDDSYLDVTTPATLWYVVRAMRDRIVSKFPRHKLADDGTSIGAGQAVVTPSRIMGELVALYSELEAAGIVENMDAFKRFLVVERNATDPNRVDCLFPPDLVNQLRVFAALVQFRLQYSATATAG